VCVEALWCYESEGRIMCVYEDRVQIDGPNAHLTLPLPPLRQKIFK